MNKKNSATLVHAALIAALYVVLTWLSNAMGLANNVIQVRFSEALTILPFFTPAAIPGLFAGCLISNTITGCMLPDIIFGSLATLLGALGTRIIARMSKASSSAKWLAPIPPILANTLIIPFILAYVYQFEGAVWYFVLTVFIGEVLSCGVLGILLLNTLDKYKKYIF